MSRLSACVALAILVVLTAACGDVPRNGGSPSAASAVALPSVGHAESGPAEPSQTPTQSTVLPDPTPAGPPANGWIAYIDSLTIHLAGPDGAVRELVDAPAAEHQCPTFAPVGNLLAYGVDGNLVIAAIGERGTIDARRVVPVPEAALPLCFEWSPDGRAIALNLGDDVVRIVELDGPMREIEVPLGVPSIGWTYDATAILAGSWQEIAIVPLDGSRPRLIPGLPGGMRWRGPYELEASPAGPHIAVIAPSCRDEPMPADEVSSCVRVLDLDGALVLEEARVADHGSITWSPDGTRLAWTDLDGIHVRSVDATKSQVIRFDTAVEGAGGEVIVDGTQGLSWSPDSTRLLCEVSTSTVRGHEHAIVSIAVDGSGDVVVHSGWLSETALLQDRDLTWQRR